MNNNAVSGMFWKLLERFGAQGVTFIVSIVLARIIEPEVYGTIALVTVITSILQVFVEGGFSNTLVQKKDADDVDFSTVFYFNLTVCITLYLILYFFAPVVSKFYQIEITSVIRVLGIVILISGVKSVQIAYVSRHLLFKKFFFATFGGTVFAAIIGIWMAYSGFGIWAIVVQNIAHQLIDTIILWVVVKWRPIFAFSFERFFSLFNYGWKFLVSSLIDRAYLEMRSLIIGKKYSSSYLAYYNRGEQFPKIIGESLNYSVSAVLLPVMSREQDNIKTVREITRKSIRVGSFITWPFMMGLAGCSKSIVSLLLTEKWLPAIPYMIAFCFIYGLFPIATANLCAINSLGRSDIFLKLEIMKKIVGLVILSITMWFGPLWIAIGAVVSSVLSSFINARPNKRLINYSYFEQISDMIPSFVLALLMAAIIYAINALKLSNIFTLLIQIPLGIIIYIVGAKILKIDSLEYCVSILRRYL